MNTLRVKIAATIVAQRYASDRSGSCTMPVAGEGGNAARRDVVSKAYAIADEILAQGGQPSTALVEARAESSTARAVITNLRTEIEGLRNELTASRTFGRDVCAASDEYLARARRAEADLANARTEIKGLQDQLRASDEQAREDAECIAELEARDDIRGKGPHVLVSKAMLDQLRRDVAKAQAPRDTRPMCWTRALTDADCSDGILPEDT